MPKRILIIEDNRDNRTIYAMVLKHAGYDVVEAEDGERGIEAVLSQLPDLIVLDIGLPGIDGWQVCSMLKADETTAAIKIIIVTAHAYTEDRLQAERSGANAYLPKPVEPRRVRDEVHRLIGSP